jgi:hypothetical protein
MAVVQADPATSVVPANNAQALLSEVLENEHVPTEFRGLFLSYLNDWIVTDELRRALDSNEECRRVFEALLDARLVGLREQAKLIESRDNELSGVEAIGRAMPGWGWVGSLLSFRRFMKGVSRKQQQTEENKKTLVH